MTIENENTNPSMENDEKPFAAKLRTLADLVEQDKITSAIVYAFVDGVSPTAESNPPNSPYVFAGGFCNCCEEEHLGFLYDMHKWAAAVYEIGGVRDFRELQEEENDGAYSNATLDQHFEDTLRRVRAEVETTGIVSSRFECVTEDSSFDFHVPAAWPDYYAKNSAYAALRDCFHHRRVNRYVLTGHPLMTKPWELTSADDPERDKSVQVIAVQRNGPWKYAHAEMTRDGKSVTLGPWEVKDNVPESWLLKLLQKDFSHHAPRLEQPSPIQLVAHDLQEFLNQHPKKVKELRDVDEIQTKLKDLILDQTQKLKETHGDDYPIIMLKALEMAVCNIVNGMGSPQGVGEFAGVLKTYPDKFSMFSTVHQVPSAHHARPHTAALDRFSFEQREIGHSLSAIFRAFMYTYMDLGSRIIGALALADRIENWSPEHLAKLRKVGLRSEFDLDDEDERHFFFALSADRYPIGVRGWRNAIGELFFSNVFHFPFPDFATAVSIMQEKGRGKLVLGPEADDLLCKIEQVEGIKLRDMLPSELLG